ncbi:MAG: hypothetical protein LKK36_19680 [Ewingella americana]|jgi:hypothetical protein|uniref:Uncharacterized protein n=2 Tax=Ewingella americana TaxID=41202 RepID=A0A085GLZ0_EWIA3|nr:hypothetical protein [Ewingella americana]KAA8728792.1 hypothetical protein F4W05_00695 [Ewingella americana]KFC84735.1 hypothetical protein GEAM_0609 [Ewingella americana ATCC 33852]MCI1676710.1 hypothetical protein [Ewingella americana]MCI1853700.1 hypothetical protein [Ewingella americana]MCI1860059.1 hypothetical protein [Ewingella americana]
MFRSEDEKLTDLLLGEAVVALLKSKSAISIERLLTQLQFMAGRESDPQRKRMCEQVINEIRHGAKDQQGRFTYEIYSTDNVRHFFNAEGPSDERKKH